MTAYQNLFFLAVSSGFVIGVLVVFSSSQQIMQLVQFSLDRAHTPETVILDPLRHTYFKTRVVGVILGVDHARHQILMDTVSPYPDGKSVRMALTYSTSTIVAPMSPEFIRMPEVAIDTLRAGTRIMAIVPREEGQLRVSEISIQP